MRDQHPMSRLVQAPWADGYAFVEGSPDRLLTGRAIAEHLAQHADVAGAAARLDGCFAAVIERPQETLLVTDRYGAVPLYVRAPMTRPLVASGDPWVVIAASPTAPARDPVAVLDMVRLGYVTGARTLVDGLHTVPPSSVVRVRDNSVEVHRYWRFEYRSSDGPA